MQNTVLQFAMRYGEFALHITNVYQWDENTKFHQCKHLPLFSLQQERKKWLKPDLPAHIALVTTVNKFLLKRIKKMNGFKHTGPLEVYNGAMTKYCPKRQHFPCTPEHGG